jgi:uncharacterized membrane protein YgdD (TMEM256/DUF423 family)
MIRLYMTSAGLLGFLSVALGAFGAHALKARLAEDLLASWETGARYMALHAVVLLFVALWARMEQLHGNSIPTTLVWSGGFFLGGTLLFSGSLVALCLTGIRGLGVLTPFGGIGLMVGWMLLIIAARGTS